MNMRRIISVLTMVCLLFACAPGAMAAPVRDKQLEEMTLDLGMQTLVDLVMGAAVLTDVSALETELQPDQALMEGVLALGMYQKVLPLDGKQLTYEQAKEMYGLVFTSGAYAPVEKAAAPFAAPAGQGLTFDFTDFQANPSIGVYIYSAAFDGADVTLLCDLYHYYDEPGMKAEDLPEETLTWLCHGEISLAYAPEAYFGYTLNGYTLSPVYLDGRLSDWQGMDNMEYEYSVTLPSILGLAEDAPGHMAWQSADGTVNLVIDVAVDSGMDYDQVLDAFLLNHPGQTVTQQREFSQFFAMGEGIYSLLVVPEGLPWAYTLTLSFPAERQAEFALYAEFIRNSLIVWGLSNG
ncbi:MAG: hypothetical protein E7324_05715 [Clostridiales bacterium]|nr:hypothetical protein [Clostridiales bacterium]